MTKRILSAVLSLALLLSCVSGITLFTAAEEATLPTPYIWITVDQTTGEVTSSQDIYESGLDPSKATKISDTAGYGIKLTGDWNGFGIGSDALLGSKAESVTMLIEYYIDSSLRQNTDNNQMFRIMPAQNFDANGVTQENDQWIDYYAATLALDKTSVMAYAYPAGQLDALREIAVSIGIKGCIGGTNCVFIKSVKIVDSRYANVAACDYYAFEESPVSDYYPGITAAGVKNMSTHLEDIYRHFSVSSASAAYSTDNTVNKPVYIRVFTKEGYEDTTVEIQQFEAYNGPDKTRWACDNGHARPTINVSNGVGGTLLPETSFTNGNNDGSFRLNLTEADKIARIEVYDVTTYCAEVNATDEMKAELHAAMLANDINTEKNGYVAPTVNVPGETGIVTCATCGAALSASTEIPKLSAYAKFDFNVNNEAGFVATAAVITANTNAGLVKVKETIPGSEDTALQISGHNQGIQFKLDPSKFGINEADLLNGTKLAISVEYYVPSTLGAGTRISFVSENARNFALYGNWQNTCWDALCVNQATPLTRDALAVATFIVGQDVTYYAPSGTIGGTNNTVPEAMNVESLTFAKNLVNGKEITLYAWSDQLSADTPVYIKSITIHDAAELVEPDAGATGGYYVDFVGAATNPKYYPEYLTPIVHGLTVSTGTEGEYYPEDTAKEHLCFNYMYVKAPEALLSNAAAQASTPVKLTIKRKAGSNIDHIYYQYQDGGPGADWNNTACYVDFDAEGVYETILWDARFFNTLNANSSIRLRDTIYEQTKDGDTITYNEVIGDEFDGIAFICVEALADKTELQEVIANAQGAGQYKTPATAAVLNEALATAEAVMANGWATEKDVTDALAALRAALAQLVDCKHQNGTKTVDYVAETCLEPGYTGNQACVDCGYIAEDAHGTVIPAHELRTINVKETSCKEPGYTGDLWCDKDQKIATSGTSIMTLPHTWDDGKVTKPANKDERGEITKTCEKCGATTTLRFDFVAEMGDVDGSGKIDSTDARLVLQFAVKKILGEALDVDVADVDGSGKIDSTDARLILQLAVGKIKEFPKA